MKAQPGEDEENETQEGPAASGEEIIDAVSGADTNLMDTVAVPDPKKKPTA